MDGTVLQQGRFTVAAGVPSKIIQIPANADFMFVRNFTQTGVVGQVAARGTSFYWQRGMAAGSAFVNYKTNGLLTDNSDTIALGGFTLYDASGQSIGALPRLGAPVAFTGISNAVQPVVLTANTAGLIDDRSVVRLFLNAGDTALASNVLGIDFVIDTVVANTSFVLKGPLANAPGITTGTGQWRAVNYDPLYYPRNRVVTNITQAVNAAVTTSVFHQMTPGQAIRLSIPKLSGMIELNSTQLNNFAYATVVSVVSELVFTIDVDTTAYTAFTFPTVAQINLGSQMPEMTPFGENTAVSLTNVLSLQVPREYSSTGDQINETQSGILADATVNTGFLGMVLGTGGTALSLAAAVTGPAGSVAGDVMFWVAGKSAFGGL